jgi:hypothetical protein
MRYRPMPWMRRMLPLGFLLFAAVAVVIVLGASRHQGPPVGFLVFWFGALGWNAYWWLFRMCTEMKVEGPTLSWSTALRHGTAPMSDVRRMRKSRMGRQLAVIELQGRRPLLVPVRYGFSDLQNALSAGAPQAAIDEH